MAVSSSSFRVLQVMNEFDFSVAVFTGFKRLHVYSIKFMNWPVGVFFSFCERLCCFSRENRNSSRLFWCSMMSTM